MSQSPLPFHPIVLVIGLAGALLLVGGILGALGGSVTEALPALANPVVWITLLVLGGLLTLAEIMLVILGARGTS